MPEKTEMTSSDPEIKIRRMRRRPYDVMPEEGIVDVPAVRNQLNARDASYWQRRDKEALGIVKNHVWWSMGGGLLPIPFLDIVAVTAIQIKMIGSLCDLYEMEFIDHRRKAIIAALIGGIQPQLIASKIAISLGKLVPGIGLASAILTMPVIAGAFTYAIGKVFIQHFESGGTFLDFDPSKVKAYFEQQYKEGQKFTREFRR